MSDAPGDLLTTQQAADALGISRRRVRQLIKAHTLPATLVGRDYVIARADLDAFPRHRPAGWPTGRSRTKNVSHKPSTTQDQQ